MGKQNAKPETIMSLKITASGTRTERQEAYKARKAMADRDAKLSEIADRVLGIPTLEDRMSASLDFHEIHFSFLRDALRKAYAAGFAAAKTSNGAKS